MNVTETQTEIFTNENILIVTNVITGSLALLSEILAVSGCKDNGIIDLLIKCTKKSVIEVKEVLEEKEEV